MLDYKGPTVADLIPDIIAKIERSRMASIETRRELAQLTSCPVPRDCNGPFVEWDAGTWTSYSGQTYGTASCRFHNPDCPLERKRLADRMKRLEQQEKQAAQSPRNQKG